VQSFLNTWYSFMYSVDINDQKTFFVDVINLPFSEMIATCLQQKSKQLIFITLSFLGRPRRVDLITWVRCPYVHPSVRPSTKSFSDSDEIWYAGRGR